MDAYTTLEGPGHSELREKSSKFLGYAFPITEEYDWSRHLDQVRDLHPRATHYCYAYRYGPGGQQFRVNDDGEPSGSAGRPILGQIDSLGLQQVIAIVVRYYGGTKLGVPGLIHAYRESARAALLAGGTTTGYPMSILHIEAPYDLIPGIMRVGKSWDWALLDMDYRSDRQVFSCRIRSLHKDQLVEALHTQAGGIYPSDYAAGIRCENLKINEM